MAQNNLFESLKQQLSQAMTDAVKSGVMDSKEITSIYEDLDKQARNTYGIKKKTLGLLSKEKKLVSGLFALSSAIVKKSKDYNKGKQQAKLQHKEINKLEKELTKERNKGLAKDPLKEKSLNRQIERGRVSLKQQNLSNELSKKSIPLVGRFAGTIGKTANVFGTISSVIGTIIGGIMEIGGFIGKLIMVPIKLLGKLLIAPFNKFLEMQSITGNLAADLGLSATQSTYLKNNFIEMSLAAMDFGGTMEEIAQAMRTYSEATGRNKIFNKDQIKGIAMIGKSTGLGIENTAQMVADFDLIGMSVNNSVSTLEEARKVSLSMNLNSTKMIQSTHKLYKDLAGFRFKEGLKEIQQLVAKAQFLRIELDGVKSLSDKLFDPEGAVELAGKMTVLGGDFAKLFGNPFELMYEAQNEPAKIMERVIDSVRNVAFKDKNGLFGISPQQRRIITEVANNLGLESEKLITAGLQWAKLGDIGLDVSVEDKMLLSSLMEEGLDKKMYIRFPKGEKVLLENFSSGMIDTIKSQMKVDKDAAINRLNFVERFKLIFDRFSLGFSKFFQKFEAAFNDDIMNKIENLGSSLANALTSFLGQDGSITTGITNFISKIGNMFDNINKVFSTDGSFIEHLKSGIKIFYTSFKDDIGPKLIDEFKWLFGKAWDAIKQMIGGVFGDNKKLGNTGMSLGTTGVDVLSGASTATGYGLKIAKMGGALGKALPGIGSALSAISAYNRFMEGDVLGGVLDTIGMIPGVGLLTSGINVGRDLSNPGISEESVNDGIYNPKTGQLINYDKNDILGFFQKGAMLSPTNSGGGGSSSNFNHNFSGTIKLDAGDKTVNLTIDDIKRVGLQHLALLVSEQQSRVERGSGLKTTDNNYIIPPI